MTSKKENKNKTSQNSTNEQNLKLTEAIEEFQNLSISSNNPSLLNKKIYRNQNKSSSISLSPNEKCTICLESESFSNSTNKKCIKCIKCNSAFHVDCYENFLPSNNESFNKNLNNNEINYVNFICIRCKIEEEKKEENLINKNNKNCDKSICCFLCKEYHGIIKKVFIEQYVHNYCLSFIKGINSFGKINLNDNDKIYDNNENIKCVICKQKFEKEFFGIIKCEEKNCGKIFHIKCAFNNGYLLSLPFLIKYYGLENNDKIPFLCKEHNTNILDSYNKYIINCNNNNISKIIDLSAKKNKPKSKEKVKEKEINNKDDLKEINNNINSQKEIERLKRNLMELENTNNNSNNIYKKDNYENEIKEENNNDDDKKIMNQFNEIIVNNNINNNNIEDDSDIDNENCENIDLFDNFRKMNKNYTFPGSFYKFHGM